MSPYQGKTNAWCVLLRRKGARLILLLSNLDIGSGHLFSSGSVDVSSGSEIETIHF
jgi:hypothetical protein